MLARIVGVIFVPAGLVKFVFYGWELGHFRQFGLPAAPAWVVAAGIIEVVGGILLIREERLVPTCALLSITMVVAIAVSGIQEGDVIPSLTLAPALLIGCLVILRRELAPAPAAAA